MNFKQFRQRYPQGGLISEFVTIDRHQYIVRVLVQVAGTTMVCALGSAESIEIAEDRARERALNLLALDDEITAAVKAATASPQISSPAPHPQPTAFSELPSPSQNGIAQNYGAAQTGSTQTVSGLDKPVSTVDTPVPAKNGTTTDSTTVPPSASPERSPQPPSSETPKALTPPIVPTPTVAASEPVATTSEPVVPTQVPEAAMPVSSAEIAEEEMVAAPLDFSEIIAQSDLELKRLGWTKEQGRDYLLQTYGKRSRHFLSDEELLEFLDYLKAQSSPA